MVVAGLALLALQGQACGAAADREAARERYDSDTRASRKALRETVRADLPAAHFPWKTTGVAVIVRLCS
ncbi:hypothetical protein [Streptomyces sp. NPDC058086]|uniref:hypothetical protein n=1 Tax=Streptomyces sp. NPDC058086 TaxID=3346334 RepID=UPI0036F0816B